MRPLRTDPVTLVGGSVDLLIKSDGCILICDLSLCAERLCLWFCFLRDTINCVYFE